MNVFCLSKTSKGECSMSNNQSSKFGVLFVLSLAILLSGIAYATSRRSGDDKGESPKYRALKNRRSAPGQNDIDKAVTLKSLLDKKNETDWSTSKGAVIEGYVIQVEKEDDGDYHIVLADDRQEADTNKWVVVEVTPAWRTRKASLSPTRVKQLHGKKVRVTGWLFYEPEADQVDPRGTRWELHPVTDMAAIEK
jgi:hypothetical protein